jgi:hypothetical protein
VFNRTSDTFRLLAQELRALLQARPLTSGTARSARASQPRHVHDDDEDEEEEGDHNPVGSAGAGAPLRRRPPPVAAGDISD